MTQSTDDDVREGGLFFLLDISYRPEAMADPGLCAGGTLALLRRSTADGILLQVFEKGGGDGAIMIVRVPDHAALRAWTRSLPCFARFRSISAVPVVPLHWPGDDRL